MKAWICNAFDHAPQFVDTPDPVPAEGQILVDIAACGVNFADTLILKGKYQKRPELPFIPGFEIAGTIRHVGAGVTGYRVGDRVMAMPDWGGYAQSIAIDGARAMLLPDHLDFDLAAGFQIAYGTAWFALKYRAVLRPGEVVLIHAAASGVGVTAVECAKILGATVIATAGGPEKCALARQQGADHVIDSAAGPIRDQLRAICAAIGRDGVDVVYDPVGGDLFDQSLRCVVPGARIVLIGFASGQVPQIQANILLVKNIAALGFYFGAYLEQNPEIARTGMAELIGFLASGKIRPIISARYALPDAMAALDAIAERRAIGKMVIDCCEK